MRTVPLGDSGVAVSEVCFGIMRHWAIQKQTSFGILDRYAELGGSFIDNANIYGRKDGERVGGVIESLLGEWMRERQNRARMFIATKVGFEYQGVERGVDAQKIERECEKSLKRMGVEAIDLYYAHVDDRAAPMQEILEAFSRLVKAGKVRFIGASNFTAWRLAEARLLSEVNGWPGYCCIQQRYSYLRAKPGADFYPQVAVNDDLLDYCATRGVALVAYSPLLGGAYTRSDRSFREQYRGPDTDARLNALDSVAAELGATRNQVVLAWMRNSDPPVIPVVAASSGEQMEENMGALEIEPSADQMSRLDQASAGSG